MRRFFDDGEGGGGGNAGNDDQTPEWRKNLPENLRDNPQVKRFTSLESLVNSFVEGRAEIDRRPAADAPVVPGENATAEQVARYRKARGIPENADDYEIPMPGLDASRPEYVPTDADRAQQAKIRAFVAELGLSKAEATKVAEMLNSEAAARRQTSADELRQHNDQVATALQAKYGSELTALAAGVPTLYPILLPKDADGTDRLAAFFQEDYFPGGVGNSQVMREVLYNLFKATKSDRLIEGNGNPGQEGAPDPSKARFAYSGQKGPLGVRYD